jgi:hypothetical protein
VAKLDFSWQSRQFELGVSVGVVNIAIGATRAEVVSGRNQIHVFDERDAAVERRQG